MNVLVAGGTGFIGTHLCRELHDRGHEVTALARDPGDADLPDGVGTAAGDVTDYDAVEGHVEGRDAVANLVSLSPLYQPPGGLDHETVHLGGTENLVRAAEHHGVERFLQLSGPGPDASSEIGFFRAKGRAERVVEESDLAWTIVRPSIVFGDGDEFTGFVRTLTTPYVTALPDGGRTRFQPIWVEDLVPMLADALEDEVHVGEVYELAGPQIVTLADATELVHGAAGRPVRVLPIPMAVTKLGAAAIDPVPFVPFGADQARSLEKNTTVVTNDVEAFGVSEDDLTSFGAYLERPPGSTAKRRPTGERANAG